MRVSEQFKLGRTQPTLDFVDVDVYGDSRVYVDPRALRLLQSTWANECVSLIQNFFSVVLRLIKKGQHDRAKSLLGALREPNETHLGLSKAQARGHALGQESASDVWSALGKSQAVTSGLLEDLEDTILMVPGISSDIISDIATNIIRQPLIHYTQSMAAFYGIPLSPGVASGPLWNPQKSEWFSELIELPMTEWGPLLLVPKAIVRRKMDYDQDQYFRHYLLEHLKGVELAANSELVTLLRDGTPRVTKKALIKKYGSGKSAIVEHTRTYPEVLEQYREAKRNIYQPPLDHLDIAHTAGSPEPDWNELLAALTGVEAGKEHFADYENAIVNLLSALFYPSLSHPQIQRPIHSGRKVIDLVFTNGATSGFFEWVARHYTAPYLFVECKDYRADPANPELDQLSGRFSASRGKVGLLTCRKIAKKDLFIERCRDTAKDGRGFIIPLDDSDLAELVAERRKWGRPSYALLRSRFDALVM